MITLEIKWHFIRDPFGDPGDGNWRARLQLVDISANRKKILKYKYIYSKNFPSLGEFAVGKIGEVIKILSLKIVNK